MNFTVAMLLMEAWALNLGPAIDVSSSLGSSRFTVRQQATRALESAWPWSAGTLQAATGSEDPDVADRAAAILRRCRDRDLDSAGPPPWADWLLWDSGTGGWDSSRCPPLSRSIASITLSLLAALAITLVYYAGKAVERRRWVRAAETDEDVWIDGQRHAVLRVIRDEIPFEVTDSTEFPERGDRP